MSPELPESLAVALRVIDTLDVLGIAYHVGGSFASSIHGVPRQTQDIDLVVDFGSSDATRLAAELGRDFHADEEAMRRSLAARESFNLIHLASGVKVDLFPLGDTPFDREEFSRSRLEVLVPEPERWVRIKSAEDTVLRKLQWYRAGDEVSERQWNDVLGVVRTQGARLDQEYLSRWAEVLGIRDLLDCALGGGPRS